jgi:peptidoglycan/xylan/chitin deacetylase (PgdA/CDA1 family)
MWMYNNQHVPIRKNPMIRVSIALLTLIITVTSPVFSASPPPPLESLKEQITTRYAGVTPTTWGEHVPGVRTRLDSAGKVLALTLDACGSNGGKGVDARLVEFLVREQIPATLFINGRWIDANPELFRQLAANPLFEIANHGIRHKPASVTGRSVYGIAGTKNIGEVVEEIELNARKIEAISGVRPKLYRSGTAYYDDIAVQISRELGHEVAGYSLLGDAGATWSASQVKAALLKAVPGDIALLHMNHPEAGTGAGIMAAVPELKKRGFKFVRMSDYPLK